MISAAFGAAKVQLDVAVSGIGSAAAVGSASVQLKLSPTGVASAAAFGNAMLQLDVAPTGIAASTTFGTAKVQFDVAAAGIASAQAFGTPKLQLDVATLGISSSQTFGVPNVTLRLAPGGLASAGAFGSPTVTQGSGGATISPLGIATTAAFGAVLVIELTPPDPPDPPAAPSYPAGPVVSSVGGGGGGVGLSWSDADLGDAPPPHAGLPAPPPPATKPQRFPLGDVAIDLVLGAGALSRGASSRAISFATGKLGKGAGAAAAVGSPVVTYLATKGRAGRGALVAGAALGAAESLWKMFVDEDEKAKAPVVRVTVAEFEAFVDRGGARVRAATKTGTARDRSGRRVDVAVITYGTEHGDGIWVCQEVRRLEADGAFDAAGTLLERLRR